MVFKLTNQNLRYIYSLAVAQPYLTGSKGENNQTQLSRPFLIMKGSTTLNALHVINIEYFILSLNIVLFSVYRNRKTQNIVRKRYPRLNQIFTLYETRCKKFKLLLCTSILQEPFAGLSLNECFRMASLLSKISRQTHLALVISLANPLTAIISRCSSVIFINQGQVKIITVLITSMYCVMSHIR